MKLLTEVDLQTLVVEIKGIMNARPLTYMSEDSLDVTRPINLLLPEAVPWTPLLAKDNESKYRPAEERDSNRENLLGFWKTSTEVLDKFWEYWHVDYLQFLHERTKFFHTGSESAKNGNPKVGEVVIVEMEGKPRGLWPMAKVFEEIKSTDQRVRAVRLKFGNGRVLTRPINQIFALELPIKEDKGQYRNESSAVLLAKSKETNGQSLFPSEFVLWN